MMRIDILTLFPEICSCFTDGSILGRAQKKGLIQIVYHNIRDYTADRHNRVDDYSYGGGPGMILQPQPIYDCFQAVCAQRGERPKLYYLSPQGPVFCQKKAFEMAETDGFALLCGHYEGVDQRVLDEIVDEEISVGNYVLTGGELAAMIVADAVCRLVPGVLSEAECYVNESLSDGLLEYPQYTRPEVWRGIPVPEVLLSGHHANIEQWRRRQSLEATQKKRPDLL